MIEKSRIDQYTQERIIKPSDNGRGSYKVTPRPKNILETIEDDLSIDTAARYLNVSILTLNRLIEKGRLSLAQKGKITRESLKQFFRKNLRRGGDKKTHWVKWQESNNDPEYIPCLHEVSYHDAAELLEVSTNFIEDRIISKELIKTQQGFITKESLEKFLAEHEKGGGKHKTLWRKKR